MAEIVLFHHAGGLTDGVLGFAQTLRDAGHTVHAPDLFDGRTFADVRDGVAYAQGLGEEVFAAKATEIMAPLGSDLVYGGMSMGAARAAEQVLERPGREGRLLPLRRDRAVVVGGQVARGRPDPGAHDRGRRVAGAGGGGGVRRRHPRRGALRLSRVGPPVRRAGHPDYDEEAARLATERVVAFLAGL